MPSEFVVEKFSLCLKGQLGCYPLQHTVILPNFYQILSIGIENETVWVYAIVLNDSLAKIRKHRQSFISEQLQEKTDTSFKRLDFWIVITGHEVPYEASHFVASINDDGHIYHIFNAEPHWLR